MTYHQTTRPRARYARRRPKPALGGLFDFVDDVIGEMIGTGAGSIQDARASVCAGDAESATSAMAAQIADLDRTWNPTGFYTIDDMGTVYTTTINYANGALDQLTAALSEVDIRDSDHKASAAVFDKAFGVFQDVQAKGDVYFKAIKGAQAEGKDTIDAPGLKSWVVQMMDASRGLAKAAFFVNCNKSTLERVSSFLNRILDAAIAIIKQVIGIAAQLAVNAFKAVGGLAGLLVTLVKYAPYIALAGGGYYLYKSYRDR